MKKRNTQPLLLSQKLRAILYQTVYHQPEKKKEGKIREKERRKDYFWCIKNHTPLYYIGLIMGASICACYSTLVCFLLLQCHPPFARAVIILSSDYLKKESWSALSSSSPLYILWMIKKKSQKKFETGGMDLKLSNKRRVKIYSCNCWLQKLKYSIFCFDSRSVDIYPIFQNRKKDR